VTLFPHLVFVFWHASMASGESANTSGVIRCPAGFVFHSESNDAADAFEFDESAPGQVFGLHDHCREPLEQFGLPRRQLGEFRGTSVRPCTDCPAATVNDRAGTPTCQAHDVIPTADKESQSAKKHSTQSPLTMSPRQHTSRADVHGFWV